MTNGEKLKEIRRVIGQVEKCTQADFAEMIGTTTGMVGKMEAGIKPITTNFKKKIYHATGAEFLGEYKYPVSDPHGTGKYERFTKETYKTYEFLETATSDPEKKFLKAIIALEFAIIHMDETICGCNHFLARKEIDRHLRHFLITGIVVSYARSFTETGMSKISSEFENFVNENEKQWHDYFLEKRNTNFARWDVVAEANAAKKQGINEIGYITIKPDGKLNTDFRRIREPNEDEFINAMKLIAEFQKSRMEKAVNKMYEHLIFKYKPGTYSIGFDGEFYFKS